MQNSFHFDEKRFSKNLTLLRQFWCYIETKVDLSLLPSLYNIILLFSATVFQGVVHYRNNKWTKHWMDPGHETFWLDPKPSKCTFVLLAQLRTQMPFKNNMQQAAAGVLKRDTIICTQLTWPRIWGGVHWLLLWLNLEVMTFVTIDCTDRFTVIKLQSKHDCFLNYGPGKRCPLPCI